MIIETLGDLVQAAVQLDPASLELPLRLKQRDHFDPMAEQYTVCIPTCGVCESKTLEVWINGKL